MTFILATPPGSDTSRSISICNARDGDFGEVVRTYSMTNVWMGPGLLLGVTALLQHVEGLIYIIIFLHIYRQEKTMMPFLTENSRKGRRRRHAMTMTGQVIIYVIEQTFISGSLFLLVASDGTGVSYWKNLGNYPVGWILVQAEFAIRCTVQALTCTETRQELINLLNGIK